MLHKTIAIVFVSLCLCLLLSWLCLLCPPPINQNSKTYGQCEKDYSFFFRMKMRNEFVPPLLLCIALAVAMAPVAARKSQRTKRGLLELAGAIKCSTGRSALAYMMYGCYCGLGGQGWPRDRADWWGTNRGFNFTLLESHRKIQLDVKLAFIFFLKISQIWTKMSTPNWHYIGST